MRDKPKVNKAIVCIIGLGYVGLPLAEAFSRSFRVIGFDTNRDKVKELSQDNDNQNLLITANPEEISKADFIIITVPTPVTKSRKPDLSHVKSAARITGQKMKKGSVAILESTVYPGVTEEIVKPILEKESGFKCGVDFKIAYSPERINPGDEEHTIDKVTKVVSGMDEETTAMVSQLYSKVALSIFEAKDIQTAEAAKVIENIQRDLNIALMNELALIFGKMGIETKGILDTAVTKWNFHKYSPGLVGGQCIPVDPYYLVYKAKELGYYPQVILAGRAVNDSMPKHIAETTIEALNSVGKVTKGSKVLIMGLTYKENVPDTRESPVKGIIKELREFGITIYGYDPLLDSIKGEFAINVVRDTQEIQRVDAVIVTVPHDRFRKIQLSELREIMNSKPILIDVRGTFDRSEAEREGFCYRSL